MNDMSTPRIAVALQRAVVSLCQGSFSLKIADTVDTARSQGRLSEGVHSVSFASLLVLSRKIFLVGNAGYGGERETARRRAATHGC